MPAVARTFTLIGIDARPVRVEVDVRGGLPTFSLVGLPDAAVRESRERVRAALANSGFDFPQQRIIANLAPADLRKAGPGFDLAIAAALLVASGQLDAGVLGRSAFAGELALDGRIGPIPGVLAMAEAAADAGTGTLVVASGNGAEAALAGVRVVPVRRLEELRLLGTAEEPAAPQPLALDGASATHLDLADLRGQPGLRRALEIAAAGAHSLLILGPPGAGKSLAARRLPSLLPPLARTEAIEVMRIASACGKPLDGAAARLRPFRAPHHTISTAGLLGGGNPPRAGEATLAHRGVLFVDELPEFRRDALEALRQPLEEGRVLIARARYAVELPCRFQLLAAANPCPCGHGERSGDCECPTVAIRRYRSRLSGALADRIDAVVAVDQPKPDEMRGAPGESSAAVRERVLAARERQERRIGAGRANAEMSARETRQACSLDAGAERMLRDGQRTQQLSGRGQERVVRLARTIADLAASERITLEHVAEALALRRREER